MLGINVGFLVESIADVIQRMSQDNPHNVYQYDLLQVKIGEIEQTGCLVKFALETTDEVYNVIKPYILLLI